MEWSHFWPSSLHVALCKTLFFDFWFRPPNAQILLPKICNCTKSPISRLVWQIDRRCLHLPGGFRGWPIQWNHAKCCGADPCCHGNDIWPMRGDLVAYWFVCLSVCLFSCCSFCFLSRCPPWRNNGIYHSLTQWCRRWFVWLSSRLAVLGISQFPARPASRCPRIVTRRPARDSNRPLDHDTRDSNLVNIIDQRAGACERRICVRVALLRPAPGRAAAARQRLMKNDWPTNSCRGRARPQALPDSTALAGDDICTWPDRTLATGRAGRRRLVGRRLAVLINATTSDFDVTWLGPRMSEPEVLAWSRDSGFFVVE